VAEAGFNHNGKLELAKKLLKKGKECNVSAVKFQTFKSEKLVSRKAKVYGVRDAKLPKYQVDLYKPFELSKSDYAALFHLARQLKFEIFSTPFDQESADLLDSFHVPVFKIASGDVTHHPLLKHVAKKKKPIMMSCGMATFDEIGEALDVIYRTGNRKVVLLHCVSNYPAKHEDMNLNRMLAIKRKFGTRVGLSDHTNDLYASFAAAALGACVIERHFTLDRNMKGVDHYFSLDPSLMFDLVKGIRTIEKTIGKSYSGILPVERKIANLARRSLLSCRNIRKGEIIRSDMIEVKRPGSGIRPKYLNRVLGMKAKTNIPAEELLQWNRLIRK